MESEIDAFLSGYPSEIDTLARLVRGFVLKNAPACSETVHTGWKVISFGHSKKFCAIAPHTKWVNLQFHAGSDLDDPTDILQGTGKSMRHAKIKDSKDLSKPLAALIRLSTKLG